MTLARDPEFSKAQFCYRISICPSSVHPLTHPPTHLPIHPPTHPSTLPSSPPTLPSTHPHAYSSPSTITHSGRPWLEAGVPEHLTLALVLGPTVSWQRQLEQSLVV